MKRIFSIILVLILLMTCLPGTMAFAADTGTGELHVSEALLNMIKLEEGFAQYPYWDYAQWTVGYGCCAGTNRSGPDLYKDGITREEADQLLRQEVADKYEKYVRAYAARAGLQLTQNQFDSLVSFTYNCGSSWTSGCRITTWITDNINKDWLTEAEELALVKAFGAWCRAGGTVLPGLCRRRITETQMFLYGDYTGSQSKQFNYIIYHAVKTTMSENGYEDLATYYVSGKPIGILPTPNRIAGYTFLGWFTSAGTQITANTIVGSNMQVYAKWQASDGTIVEPPDTDEPDEPEEPEIHISDVFSDVSESAWYAEYVAYVYKNGLFSGMTESTFGPNENLSRAMLVTVLYRHAGEPKVTADSSFTDVPKGAYYADAVAWAEQNGIVNGMSKTQFAPKDLITREQIATILYRYCVDYQGIKAKGSSDLSDFQDRDRVSSYAQTAMEWAVGNGIITGMSKTELAPRGNATRAQAAAMLTRLIQEILE